MLLPIRNQKAVDQGLQAVGFRNDDFGVLALLGRGELAFQELRCAANAAKGVFHLVREVS